MNNICNEDLIENADPIDPFDTSNPHHEQYKCIFKDLQGGIIKNYGRNYSLYIFIQFDENNKDEIKQWIRNEIAPSITSTWKQLNDTKRFKEEMKQKKIDCSMPSGELCTNFFLSCEGYKVLGFNFNNPDPRFKQGMRKDWETSYRLSSPPQDAYWYNPPEYWDIGGGKEQQNSNVPQQCSNTRTYVHALVLLAHDDLEQLKNAARDVISKFEDTTATKHCERIGKVVACEAGYVLRDRNCQAIGPFGFVDGISQPLFLKSDYDKYRRNQNHQVDLWDPKASLNLVLIKDPFGMSHSYGSYCVFQKLETDYKCFEEKVEELAKSLEIDHERASALVIGRYRNGIPIALQPNQIPESSSANNFNYADDRDGLKCPLHAHIRKTNPRGDEPSHEEGRRERSRIFRAGVTYFDNPNSLEDSGMLEKCLNKLSYLQQISASSLEESIENIIGLLFVCFQRSITNQFSKIQLEWADDRKFPRSDPKYLDPIIGHPFTSKQNQKPPKPQEWKENGKYAYYSFYGCVKNRGGEFFFAPSVSCLNQIS